MKTLRKLSILGIMLASVGVGYAVQTQGEPASDEIFPPCCQGILAGGYPCANPGNGGWSIGQCKYGCQYNCNGSQVSLNKCKQACAEAQL